MTTIKRAEGEVGEPLDEGPDVLDRRGSTKHHLSSQQGTRVLS